MKLTARLFLATTIGLASQIPFAGATGLIPEVPLITSQSSVPLTMIVMGKDHKLFYEAYNDASDINGDGILDIRFDPSITYYGLFDSGLCYEHSGGATNTDLFKPSGKASDGKCSGKWSGNFLNYLTTTRLDALRKVFYGGTREIDTASQTVLRRSYIPQDAHSWAKEYTSETVDGYKISDYTPLSQPNTNRRHFFGSLTRSAGKNCKDIEDCTSLPPLLSVVTNSNVRVWQWASTERPVLADGTHKGTRTDYTVRVEVCTASYNEGCKLYPKGNYKPVGLLHDYGENNAMYFGLLTGSYNKNMDGGVLRKVISSFTDEIDADNGTFKSAAKIVRSLDALVIRDFNNNFTSNQYRTGWVTTRPMNAGEFADWGNPIGEMMYEAMRYFAGKKAPTSDFLTSGSRDADVGLSPATWDNPYESTSAAKAPWCAKPNMLVVSDINPSFDSDKVPGSAFGSFTGDISGFSAASVLDTITAGETGIVGNRFIGQNCTLATCYDGAPTPKAVTSLSLIRGLAPEEPTKQGSYNAAAVAHFGKTNDLSSTLKGKQLVDHYIVALSSPLPKIEFKVGDKVITMVPFAKSVGGSSISATKGNFQPTDQIVDFYVESIANTNPKDVDASVNDGRPYAKFRINFEDVEQGADHDMDAISEYEVAAQADGTLKVTVRPVYQAGGIRQNMGYIISGTTDDGVYLVVQDENVSISYYLNVPPGQKPGYCDTSPSPADCSKLPYLGGAADFNHDVRVFTPGANTAATLLRNPLWYAAKWGGFVDRNGNNKPDLKIEWDGDNNGDPDTYFLVQNPLKLKESLKKSFDTIVERSASSGNITSNGQQLNTDSKVFQSQFNSATWDGELFAYQVTTTGVSTSPAWKASEQLPSDASTRNIFTTDTDTASGTTFTWDGLNADQQVLLGSEDILDYLRGDQSNELAKGGSLRNRNKLLGDIVHSSPYFVKDTQTVYIGANDGMLHAFGAETGEELFAYVPSFLFDKLASLSEPGYTHKFFMDGEVAVSPKDIAGGKNILVGSTGRGARGLFALDVTSPGSFTTTDVLWELDGSSDNDFGFVLGRPQIGRLENGEVVVAFGNGYNSPAHSSVLYVLKLSTGELLAKIDTDTSGGNGMATPLLWDADGNELIDTIYAGDLRGNVWKFDVSGSDPGDWGSSFLSGSTPRPFFTALDGSNIAQPITAQVTAARNTITSDPNFGETFVFFGTGSFTFGTDPDNKQVQSWYGLIDRGSAIESRTELVERKIQNKGTASGRNVRVFSEATAGDVGESDSGWVVDLRVEGEAALGERIVTRSNVIQLIEPTLLASSIIPDPDPCEAGGTGYINFINPFTGGRLKYPAVDLNGDGKFDDADKLGGEVPGSLDPEVGMPGEAALLPPFLVVSGSTGEIAEFKLNFGIKMTGRLSWREIIKD